MAVQRCPWVPKETAMRTMPFHDDVVPQDTTLDDSSAEANSGQPFGETEIEELLYGGERSTAERLDLLRALREDIAERDGGDFGDFRGNDPRALLHEIDSRIAELIGAERDGARPGALDPDPLAHRETLSPDSDELEALEEDDEASLEEEEDLFGEDAEDQNEDESPGTKH